MNANSSKTGPQDSVSIGNITVNGRHLPMQIFIFCLLAELLFVLLDATVNYAKFTSYDTIRRLFNITREDSLATWFMVTQTFVAAQVLWLTFLLQRSHGAAWRRIAGWGFLASFFTYMAADDGAKIHERFGTMFSIAYGDGKSDDANSLLGQIQTLFPSYEWQLVALPLLVGAGLFMLFFLWREFHARAERQLLLLATACMALAVGLDFVEGLEVDHALNMQVWIRDVFELRLSMIRHYAKSLEEFLEMLGISLLLMLFLRHLIRISGSGLTFSFSKAKH